MENTRKLWFKFGLHLTEQRSDVRGPVFHRWHPRGSDNAIELDTGDPNASLRIWFALEVEASLGLFSLEKIEDLANQGAVQGGPLRGLLSLKGVDDQTVEILEEGAVEKAMERAVEAGSVDPDTASQLVSDKYVTLAKRVAQKIIQPSVSRFVERLRNEYGQYWLVPPREWDSTQESLGGFCSHLQLRWSTNPDGKWRKLLPDLPEACGVLEVGGKDSFKQFITETDWDHIGETLEYEPARALAVDLTLRARRLLDEGNVHFALIESVTALELAVRVFVRAAADGRKALLKKLQEMYDQPRPWQVIAVGLGRVSNDDLIAACDAIRMRNKMVHDGAAPEDRARDACVSVLHVVQVLISPALQKMPSIAIGNLRTNSWD
jgi:hypothetical protein